MELVAGWWELLAGKTALMLAGSPADQFCAFFYPSLLLGSKGLAHEIYVIFWVSSRSSNWWAGWKIVQFSEGDKDGH